METNDPYQAPGANVYDVAAEGVDETGPFSPAGRFGRLSYIAWTTVMNIVVNIVSMVFAGGFAAAQEPSLASGAMLLLVGLMVAFLVVWVLFSIRRMHDINASAWWLLLLLVPVVNIILLLVLLIKAGTAGANNFGPPRITPTWEKVVGIIGIVFMVIGLVMIVAIIATIPMSTA
jgi:uncharacterized membrane protein YhaH (DUF805 family)